MSVRPVVRVYFKARKKRRKFGKFPENKPLEMEKCLLGRKIAFPLPEKNIIFLQWCVKSESCLEFLAVRWANGSGTISMCMCRFSHAPRILHFALMTWLSDLIILGGGTAVTQRSRALTECSPLLFRRSSKIISFSPAEHVTISEGKKSSIKAKEPNSKQFSGVTATWKCTESDQVYSRGIEAKQNRTALRKRNQFDRWHSSMNHWSELWIIFIGSARDTHVRARARVHTHAHAHTHTHTHTHRGRRRRRELKIQNKKV